MSRFSLFGRKENAEPAPEKKGWFGRLAAGLKKSSEALTGNVAAVFTRKKLDAATLEALYRDTFEQALRVLLQRARQGQERDLRRSAADIRYLQVKTPQLLPESTT